MEHIVSLEKKNGTRLNKAVARTGYCSRRKADELIFAGRVLVNGCEEKNFGRHVLPDDVITADDCVLDAGKPRFYLLLNKPVQVVCTMHDPQGRPTVVDCLPQNLADQRLYPVGRLDYFSEGLLLLTNDGELAHRLMHPGHHQLKKYAVLVRGEVNPASLRAMRSGMRLAEGEKILPVDVEQEVSGGGNTLLTMSLGQGVNRQIRRMCRDLGLTILRLKRTAQGILSLGDLPPGHSRLLDRSEAAALRESVSLT
ncbi:ribosomal large subunit pseudouridine synthase B [Deltaproteobacteria bacterium]|nr:ribosomal large subunit pseudouridine synthase B [Deltaproteobacteria bacterium]